MHCVTGSGMAAASRRDFADHLDGVSDQRVLCAAWFAAVSAAKSTCLCQGT